MPGPLAELNLVSSPLYNELIDIDTRLSSTSQYYLRWRYSIYRVESGGVHKTDLQQPKKTYKEGAKSFGEEYEHTVKTNFHMDLKRFVLHHLSEKSLDEGYLVRRSGFLFLFLF